MMRWKSTVAAGAAFAALSLAGFVLSPASGAVGGAANLKNPPTGVGSCSLKNPSPKVGARDVAKRLQTYRPDNYDCDGAEFAKPGVEFARFPQPKDFHVTDTRAIQLVRACHLGVCTKRAKRVLAPTTPINPLAPYFPPFTHFVIIMRENHTFDDYLGDCATTIQAGCHGVVESVNHISQVPDLHALAKTYALGDAYSTGTQPPSGPNHWWLFSAQSSSSSQQQSYPTATGTQFDRFLAGTTGPPGEGTNPCTAQTGTGTGSSPYTFVTNGDFYWMLNSGSGYWRDPATSNLEVLPVDRPGTNIPEELHYNEYTCSGTNISDQTVGNDYLSFVSAHGLPAYSYVELFNDHPGSFQNIPMNDSVTKQIVDSIMNNASYKGNTVIVVTEDDTQNGNNGPDHISNTYRVPLVVVGSPLYVKAHYVSHVAYTTSNVIAAMERVMENVHPGIINSNGNLGLSTFPMTTADQAALGDPLEDFWVQGSTPLSATASGSPTTGNAPLNVSFTGAASGGTAPYSYSWSFGDGATSTAQNPSHAYSSAGTYTATLTVTDSSSPAHTATSNVTINVNAVGNPLQATASAIPTSGQVPLNVSFTGSASGGNPPYSYSWSFGDGSATSTAQNPSHVYNTPGSYTARLTVTDSSSPAQTASSSVAITASPIAGTTPGPPQNLTGTPGNGLVSLIWQAPASNGGVEISSYRMYRGTSSGNETLVTTGGCSNLAVSLSCTDTGLTNGQKYYYKVSAVNAIGEGTKSNEATATPASGTCSPAQLLGNRGFENGSAKPAPWKVTSTHTPVEVINDNTQEPPHNGMWDAWLDGWGTTTTDTLSQTVTLPAGCSKYSLSFWLHIDTAESTTTTAYDTLKVQILNSSGTVLSTLHTYSNLNHCTGYIEHFFDLSRYAHQTITLKFTGQEDHEYQTSFVIDDTAIRLS